MPDIRFNVFVCTAIFLFGVLPAYAGSPLTPAANLQDLTDKAPVNGGINLIASGESEELADWKRIQNSTDPDDIKDFLEKHPNGTFSDIARTLLNLREDAVAASTTVQPPSPTADNPVNEVVDARDFDGNWLLTAAKTSGPNANITFCRPNESLRGTIKVKNGLIDQQFQTNKGSPVNVTGEFSDKGQLKLEVIPWGAESAGYSGTVELGELKIVKNMVGRKRVRATAGADCKVQLNLTRR